MKQTYTREQIIEAFNKASEQARQGVYGSTAAMELLLNTLGIK